MRLDYQPLAGSCGRWACQIDGEIPTITFTEDIDSIRRQLAARQAVAFAACRGRSNEDDALTSDPLWRVGRWLGETIGVSLPSTCKLVSLELCEQTGGLPWELLPAGDRPVGLVGPVQRQLRQHDARPIQIGKIRRVLLIAGENTEPKLPCLEMEIKAIERFGRHHNVFVDRWRPDANRVADLIDKVAHADIVHVCGHVHEAMTEDGRFEHRLQLDGHRGTELSVASLVPAGRPRPRLVWLNTCNAGMPIAGGAAASLLEAGCTSLVGSLLPIADETAAKFVHLFYQRLIAGGDVAWCIYELRRSLAAMAHPGWSSIVSYGKGDRLF